MSRVRDKESAADYFGLRSARNIPESVVIVPTYSELHNFAGYLDSGSVDKGEAARRIGMDIWTGVFQGTPVALMACGFESASAGLAMHYAAPLKFKKAVFFGRSKAVGEKISPGQFVLPTEASSWYEKIKSTYDIEKAGADQGLLNALQKGLDVVTDKIVYHKGRTHTIGICPRDFLTREALGKRYLCLDDKLYLILDIAKKNKIRAAALLYVDGVASDEGCSCHEMPPFDGRTYDQLLEYTLGATPEDTSLQLGSNPDDTPGGLPFDPEYRLPGHAREAPEEIRSGGIVSGHAGPESPRTGETALQCPDIYYVMLGALRIG